MKAMSDTVNISELKNRLSHYLRRVREGETLVVCDRDRVVARIEPAGGPAETSGDERMLAVLERKGTLRRGFRQLEPGWNADRVSIEGDLVGAVLAEREEGR
jgi:prevent-host-death family protein